MAIQPFELEYSSGHSGGVVLVCSTTCLPLPLETSLFRDMDDAEAFLSWAHQNRCRDIRWLPTEKLRDVAHEWALRGMREEWARMHAELETER